MNVHTVHAINDLVIQDLSQSYSWRAQRQCPKTSLCLILLTFEVDQPVNVQQQAASDQKAPRAVSVPAEA